MAFYRQLLVITVPSVAVLFGIYWYRRKRGYSKNDPGGNLKNTKTLKQELDEAIKPSSAAIPIRNHNQNGNCVNSSTPSKVAKSAPIDIVPNGNYPHRSSLQLTEKQLDIEIQKAKSEKLYDMDVTKRNSKENTPPGSHNKSALSKSTSPQNGKSMDVQRKQSPKHDTPVISCLADQLMNSKLREMEQSNDNSPPKNEKVLDNSRNNQTETSPLNQVASDLSKDEDVCDRKSCNLSVISNKKSDDVIEETVVVKQSAKLTNNAPNKGISSISPEKVTKGNKRSKKNKVDKKLTIVNNTKSFAENNVDSNESNTNSSQSNNISNSCEEVNDTLCNISRNDVNLSNTSETETRNIDRDSANHSPVDTMLASPSISHFSDNHSEGSNDSGKGCSESPSPPPPNVNDMTNNSGYVMHQFLVPQNFVGFLIGIKKNFINKLNNINGAKVRIRPHPTVAMYQVCSVNGLQSDVDVILDMIRHKVPDKKFQNMSYKDISHELYEIEMNYMADCYHLSLVEGVNNDTIVSCYVSPSQLFLQQPTHPTYPSLHILHNLMGTCYQDTTIPSLPPVLSVGMVCAAPTANNWYRTQIISINTEKNTSIVKLVDFGGFMSVENSLLKQIRKDFMMLPFQATEVQLADIGPVEDEWSSDAVQIIAGLTTGQLLQAQVVGYDEFGTPQVYLYLTLGPQHVISLNQELIVRGLAKWIEQES